jgi:hypothetical protein
LHSLLSRDIQRISICSGHKTATIRDRICLPLHATTARKAYQDVFAFWKDADNDIPVLIEADFVAAEFCSGIKRH